jgi:hypothetical protein
MASANVRKPCVKCSKGSGVAICDGCQQSFCIKHFGEHRQELSQLLENIAQEHDLLRRDLDQHSAEHCLLDRINMWEQETIARIRLSAEEARTDLRELLNRNKEELKKSVTKITDELQLCRESFDYTEVDINKWSEQLQALRKLLESSSTICITENDISKSIIHLIRVRDEQHSHSSNFAVAFIQHPFAAMLNCSSSHERFDEIDGKAKASEENLLVTCYSKTFLFPTIIYGTNRYSTGIHCIHFRIENIGNSIFFGISTSSDKIRRADVFDKSLYGWWDLVRAVVGGELQKNADKKIATMGDQVTLVVDCNNRQIQLQHHQTNHQVKLVIDLDNCPFPWKIVVKLRAEGDCIRILQ